jgi:hypothetical protein
MVNVTTKMSSKLTLISPQLYSAKKMEVRDSQTQLDRL